MGAMTDESSTPGSAQTPLHLSELPPILTTTQAARALQMDRKTVLKLAREGKMPGNKIGADWRFDRDGILALIVPGPHPAT